MAVNIKLDAVLKLPLWQRALVVAAVNLLLAGLSYQFLLAPKQAEVERLKQRSAELERELTRSRIIAKDIPKYEREREELEEKLKKALAQLPNEKEIPDLLKSISDAAGEAGLHIVLFKPRAEIPKGFYAEVPVDMIVEGRYESLFKFCVKVGELPRIVNIGTVDIASKEEMSRIPTLNAKFIVTTFRFVSSDEAAGAEGAGGTPQ
ncbi:MAG TPA: pilus assembly protein PilO [Deltaproteobacteria bacterium]|nr:pilus assembly protein PilO [Deltaproteobacteria bacterium]